MMGDKPGFMLSFPGLLAFAYVRCNIQRILMAEGGDGTGLSFRTFT